MTFIELTEKTKLKNVDICLNPILYSSAEGEYFHRWSEGHVKMFDLQQNKNSIYLHNLKISAFIFLGWESGKFILLRWDCQSNTIIKV